MKLYDFNKYPLSNRNAMYGGNSGDKEGISIGSEYWIVKYPKKASKLKDVKNMSYAFTPLSEYIGSHIYEILGFAVHETFLGIRDGYIVVGCTDFCNDGENLIEFRQLKNTHNRVLSEKLDQCVFSPDVSHLTLIDEVMIHLDYNPSMQKIDGLKERFWDCVVIDGFINNNDRNNGNWGIIRNKESDVLAPVFDNGAAFSPNVPEYKIINKLNDGKSFIQSSCSCVTAYSIDGKNNALFRDILKLDVRELKDAIKKNVPLIQKKLPEINAMIDEIPEEFEGLSVISKARKEVYKQELSLRMENLLVPEYKDIIAEELDAAIKAVENKSGNSIGKEGNEKNGSHKCDGMGGIS